MVINLKSESYRFLSWIIINFELATSVNLGKQILSIIKSKFFKPKSRMLLRISVCPTFSVFNNIYPLKIDSVKRSCNHTHKIHAFTSRKYNFSTFSHSHFRSMKKPYCTDMFMNTRDFRHRQERLIKINKDSLLQVSKVAPSRCEQP